MVVRLVNSSIRFDNGWGRHMAILFLSCEAPVFGELCTSVHRPRSMGMNSTSDGEISHVHLASIRCCTVNKR